MHRLLQDLRNRYEIVLLDTAPLLAIADTRILAPHADAVDAIPLRMLGPGGSNAGPGLFGVVDVGVQHVLDA